KRRESVGRGQRKGLEKRIVALQGSSVCAEVTREVADAKRTADGGLAIVWAVGEPKSRSEVFLGGVDVGSRIVVVGEHNFSGCQVKVAVTVVPLVRMREQIMAKTEI